MEKLYTIKEVAVYFQVSVQAVYKWINENKINVTTTPGGEKRIKESEIKRILGN